MATKRDDLLDLHQRQCDSRYVHWAWLAGALVGLLGFGGWFGWSAHATITENRRIAEVADRVQMDSISAVAERVSVVEQQMERMRVLADSLPVWLPRIEQTVNTTQIMVRRWGR